MHSSNPENSQQTLIPSLDNNPILTTIDLERLKQQSQHCNGTIHNNHLISTSTQTNHNQLNTPIFTNSQKEVFRLIGQHLQSVGLRYIKKRNKYLRFLCFVLVKQLIVLY